MRKLTDREIHQIYQMIKDHYEKHLKQQGVKLPKLSVKGKYTKDALVLVYLARNYPKTKKVSKEELTGFIRQYYPDTADVQQARHLASQKGWYIASGTRGNSIKAHKLKYGEYKLISLKKPYPGFIPGRREETINWEEIKKRYGYRCATCGSKEGEENFHWPGTITRLVKAHKDPSKPLTPDNIIPRYEKCDRADRNNWVYDERGRVIKIANPKIIKRCDEEVQWEVYRILYNKFKGKNPNA